MSSPKEKAEDLVSTFLDKLYNNGSLSFKRILHSKAIECAIIAVNEILNINSVDKDYELSNYWNEVLEEINKL
jgi:hypothetical protein